MGSRERGCKKTHNTRFLEKKRTISKRPEGLYERGIRERTCGQRDEWRVRYFWPIAIRRLRKVKAGRLGDRRSRAVSGETQFSSINAQLPANNVITGAFKLLRDAYGAAFSIDSCTR